VIIFVLTSISLSIVATCRAGVSKTLVPGTSGLAAGPPAPATPQPEQQKKHL
jgi:hypothetical protein